MGMVDVNWEPGSLLGAFRDHPPFQKLSTSNGFLDGITCVQQYTRLVIDIKKGGWRPIEPQADNPPLLSKDHMTVISTIPDSEQLCSEVSLISGAEYGVGSYGRYQPVLN